jgi:hypothetical protein
MALFKVTTRARKLTNGILIEPGMSVEMSTVSAINPITANGGHALNARIVSIKKMQVH